MGTKLRGLQKLESKNNYSSTIQGEKNKVISNLLRGKPVDFFEHLHFFPNSQSKKLALMLLLSKFQNLKTNLWLIYNKKFEMSTFMFVF